MSGSITVVTSADRAPLRGTRFSVLTWIEGEVWPADFGHRIAVRLDYDPELSDWRVTEFTARAGHDHDEITTESLRQLAVGQTAREVVTAAPAVLADSSGVDFWTFWARTTQYDPPLRADGPTAENLELVAEVYHAARVLKLGFVETVSGLFSLPSRTASHWIRLAKDRGQLVLPDDDGANAW